MVVIESMIVKPTVFSMMSLGSDEAVRRARWSGGGMVKF